MPPCWCLPAAETAFPSDMLSSVSSLFGVMHCDASLSLPRPGSSLCLLSRLRLPSAPVCSADVAIPLASPPPSSLSDQIPLQTYSCSTAAITPTRQHGNPPLPNTNTQHEYPTRIRGCPRYCTALLFPGPRAVSSLYTRYARARHEYLEHARHETARTATLRGDTICPQANDVATARYDA